MTPEQIAARVIARAHAERATAFPWDDLCDEHQATYLAAGRRAVEALAGAGLVVMTAERAAKLIEDISAYRVALAKIHTIATDGPLDASTEALWRDKGRIQALAVEQIREKGPRA